MLVWVPCALRDKNNTQKMTIKYSNPWPSTALTIQGSYDQPCCGTMKKVTLTVPWGQFDPNIKNSTTLHVWVSDYFTYSIIISRSNFYSWHCLDNHLLRSSLTKLLHSLQMNLGFLSFDLGQMSLNTSKDTRTSLHDYPRRLAIMLRSARHRTKTSECVWHC